MSSATKTVKVDYIARVEGEGGLDIRVSGGQIQDLRLNIFEPPRFFQGFLIGRSFDEVPDLVSRICGICPVSHQLASINALEDALGFVPDKGLKDLRKLFALSQWIQSHALHIFFLAAPDFLGYESVIAMAVEYPDVVKRALKLKRLGNDITAHIGGREVHPVTAKVGGFTKVPDKDTMQEFRKRLEEAKEDAVATVEFAASLPIPQFERKCEHVALSQRDEYAVIGGRIKSTEGLDIDVHEYRDYIKEKQVPHSTTLHSYIVGRDSFMVGPLPRVNINFDKLSPDAQEAARKTGIPFPNFNPYNSIVARAIELVHAIDESIWIIDRLDYADRTPNPPVRSGKGAGRTEAPRGFLYHSYELDDEGLVRFADIVAPTSHNLYNIEKDLWELVPQILDLSEEEATLRCEMMVRNYDPCISCSCHFLKLRIHRD